MYAKKVTITLLPKYVGDEELRNGVRLAIRTIYMPDVLTMHSLLEIVRSLLRGESWSPDPGLFCEDPNKSFFAEIASIEIEPMPDPWAELNKKRAEEQKLLEAGASGDAEAAIRFCKELLAGTISYGQACG